MANVGKGLAGLFGGALEGAKTGASIGLSFDELRMRNEQQKLKAEQEAQQLQLERDKVAQQQKQFKFQSANNILDKANDIFKSLGPKATASFLKQNAGRIDEGYSSLGYTSNFASGLEQDAENTAKAVSVFATAKQKLTSGLALSPDEKTTLSAAATYLGVDKAADEMNQVSDLMLQQKTQGEISRLTGGAVETEKGAKAVGDLGIRATGKEPPFSLTAEPKTSTAQSSLDDSRVARAADNSKAAIISNPIYKELAKQDLGSNFLVSMVDLVKQGNQVAANSMGAKAARAMGEVGVLTEQDVSRYVQGGSLPRKTADKLLKWTKGRPSDMTLEEISQVHGVFQKQFEKNVQPIINRQIETFARNWLKTKPNDENWSTALKEAEERIGFPYVATGKDETPKLSNKEVDDLFSGFEVKK